ncbi:TGF-beta-activated kinase 1 and MAP3K7-binding protein 2-like isoform X3 [Littorina saxatilis]|uniref:TGF-beta-activated kinase 1 and MAP3K7-binding protein 2-like isoform X3 n=1 Tax=Littorina saxatilis TaxID=31220 RepID=UPI0038B6541F
MAQKMLEAKRMPELQLRQELRTRFPEINGSTVVKVMKMYNNDTEKCIQHLEQESQKFLFEAPPESNNHSQPANHNNNFNHSANHNVNRNNSHQPGAVGKISNNSPSSGVVMPRYQEVPVEHKTTHISTVQHTVGSPAIPPKPNPPPAEVSTFAHPTMPPVQPTQRQMLVIDPANQPIRAPFTAPARPNDFSPFTDLLPRKQTDIPNIPCGPTSFGGASSGSPESRRPVRVMHVHGYTSGGTVTSGQIQSPTSGYSNSRFRVILGDGGGVCLPASSAPVTSPTSNPYRFMGQAYVQPHPSWGQETQQPGTHSSSIFIDATKNPRRSSVQETGSEPMPGVHPNQYAFRHNRQFPESPGPVSVPPTRTAQPLTVSLASHATLPPARAESVVSGLTFNSATGYSSGYSNSASSQNPSSSFVLNSGSSGVGRYTQEGASPSPPRSYPVAMSQLTISPGAGAVGPPFSSSTSSSPIGVGMGVSYGAGSPVLLHKSPSLQHQRSIGSSTSRSNSQDSEHGSVHHPSDSPGDPGHLAHPLRGISSKNIVGIGVGMPVVSPASSQSSLSSESSTRDRDANSSQRQRSGSMQEEAAYSQALLHHQQLRMDKLNEDIERKRQLLNGLREEVSEAEKSKIEKKSLRTTFPTTKTPRSRDCLVVGRDLDLFAVSGITERKSAGKTGCSVLCEADDIARLCESNRSLQTDIQMYLNEIDMYKNGQAPFTVLDPMGQQNFFNNMPTGPNDLFTRPQNQHHRSPPPPPPPRPPPPRLPAPHPTHPTHIQRFNSDDLSQTVPAPGPADTRGGGSGDSEEGERWACGACTFENHPALKKCEMCEMPRMIAGS